MITQTLDHAALDGCDNAFEVASHFVVPKSNDVEALAIQPRRSAVITRAFDIVLAAVDFDNEPCRQTYEIHDVNAQGKLPPETDAMYSLEAKVAPQKAFRLGGIRSELSGAGHTPPPTPSRKGRGK